MFQLADEISRGVWVLSRASLDTLDVMEHRHADEAAKERHGMRWCVDQRHGAWSRVMAELGGEHFAFAQMSRDIDALWEKGQ